MHKFSQTKFSNSFLNLIFLLSFVFSIACSGSNANTNNDSTTLSDDEVEKLLTKNTCSACHKKDQKFIGPSYTEIAAKNYTTDRMVELVYKPEPENWPEYQISMVALPHIPKNELQDIAVWINSLN
ncbi:MAG: hypothetical protein OEX22_08100 [Cyclobacteriaceae bacterium]|nr:hypothetical protein [Cyclobacteriaceae bacterium]